MFLAFCWCFCFVLDLVFRIRFKYSICTWWLPCCFTNVFNVCVSFYNLFSFFLFCCLYVCFVCVVAYIGSRRKLINIYSSSHDALKFFCSYRYECRYNKSMFINIIIIKGYHYYMIWLCSDPPTQSVGCG